MANPVVVLVPCYNEPSERIAASVETALATPGVDLVRVIDDGSTAPVQLNINRVEVLRYEKNGGPAAALQFGAASLPADAIVCRLDVGDAYYPEPKARQIAEVRAGVRASASPCFDEVLGRVHPVAPDWEHHIHKDCQFSTVTAVYRRSVLDEVGGFDTSLRWCEDWLFTVRVHAFVGWRIFPEVTCAATQWPGGHTDVSTDPVRRKARDADYARAVELCRVYSNPTQYKHLFDPRWCAKRGLVPLKRPNDR